MLTRHRGSIEQDKTLLPGILAEFRAALLAEIEAARRSPSSAPVPLVNGRHIAQIGSSWQYVFDIENVLNLPADAPGDLHVPGRDPIEVNVISIEGLSITLSTPVVRFSHLRCRGKGVGDGFQNLLNSG